MKRLLVFAVLIGGALACLMHWDSVGRAIDMPDAPAGRFPCVSYAPFHRDGQTPLVKGTVVSRSQIDADLKQIARSFRCVRTYSVAHGLTEVPQLARRHGLRVLLGIWIGPETAENELEIAQGITVLKRDADVIDAAVVGNEVLLRRDQPAAALVRYLARVRAATAVPVTYADVWEYWLRNPAVAATTNFVTVHILPYWEDDPIAAEHAVDHVLDVYARVRAVFTGKRVLIGETGWPSAGRQRAGAVPSLVNQARFVRTFARIARERDIDYNLVEAYDQPWKRTLEGTVGGYWGFFDAGGAAKYPLSGALAENALWQRGCIAATFAAVLFTMLALMSVAWVRPTGLVLLALAGAVCGDALWQGALEVARGSRNLLEAAAGNGYLIVAGWSSYCLARALAAWNDGMAPASVPAPVTALARWFMTNVSAYDAREHTLGLLRFVLLFGMSAVCVLLLADPRYRNFPVAVFAVPAVGYALLACAAHRDTRAYPPAEERALALLTGICAIGILIQEGWQNRQALEWGAVCLSLAAAVIAPWAHSPRPTNAPA